MPSNSELKNKKKANKNFKVRPKERNKDYIKLVTFCFML
jgi:hypothetical protein